MPRKRKPTVKGGVRVGPPPSVAPIGQVELPKDYQPPTVRRAPYVARALAQRQQHIREARHDVNAFTEYCFDRPDGLPVAQGWIHRQWQALMEMYPRLMIVAPRGHGKCLPDDELVTLSTGAQVRAVDLPKEFEIRTWAPWVGWHNTPARKWRQHSQPIVEIETRPGRVGRASCEHPYYTPSGWVEAHDLKPGMFVATCRNAHKAAAGLVQYDNGLAWLAGLLIGDGGLTGRSSCNLTASDSEVVGVARAVACSNGWCLKSRSKKSPIEWSITGKRGGALRWLRGLGMHGLGAHDKTVPDEVLGWDRAAVASFVAGYMTADGSVVNGRAGRAVEFSSVSLALVRGLQSLLLRWGVQSRIQPRRIKYKGTLRRAYVLFVRGSSLDTLSDFLSSVPTVLSTGKLRKLHAVSASKKANDNLDLIPDAVVDKLAGRFKRIIPRLDSRRPRGHMRWKVIRRAKGASDRHVEMLAELSWEQITRVTHQPAERTWSIESDIGHTLLAGDFITHNTTAMASRALFSLGNDPNQIVKLLCQSDAKSVKRLHAIRDHMKSNDRLHAVFPHMDMASALEWNKHQVTVQRGIRSTEPSLEALGITSSASGDRATLLIADDVVDRRNAITLPKVREAIKSTWDDWVNLLIHGRIVYICTLWHNSDLTHDLLENPEWAVAWYEITDQLGCVAKLPDGQVYNGSNPLWGHEASCPHHGVPANRSGRGACRCGPWTRDRLEQRRRELGASKFARGFSNRPMAEGELKVDPEWIHYWEARPAVEAGWHKFIGIDLASTQGARSDWTGVCTLAVNPATGHQAVLEAHHHKLRFPDKIELIRQLNAEHHPEGFVIELAAGGRELAEYLVTKTSIPVLGVRPKAGAGKAARLDRISPLLQNGQILFNPNLDPEAGMVNDQVGNLVKELLNFPIAAHEDIMDAFVHAANYASLAYPGAEMEWGDDPGDEDDEYDEVEDAYSVVTLY